MINLLNKAKCLSLLLKAVICQEVTFRVMSPVPLDCGTFDINKIGQGMIKIQNTSSRDMRYDVSGKEVHLCMENELLNRIGFECLIEIRRSGKSSNALNSVEREHLESSVSR